MKAASGSTFTALRSVKVAIWKQKAFPGKQPSMICHHDMGFFSPTTLANIFDVEKMECEKVISNYFSILARKLRRSRGDIKFEKNKNKTGVLNRSNLS